MTSYFASYIVLAFRANCGSGSGATYLFGRIQHVRINQSLSAPLPVLSGVPQGSILGPLLFIIYMNDSPSCVTISKTLLFIDDTKIYNTVCSPGDISAFQNDLDSATLWSTRNDMFFNPKKSVHLSINVKVITNYKIADTQVLTNSSHKDLGIIISSIRPILGSTLQNHNP